MPSCPVLCQRAFPVSAGQDIEKGWYGIPTARTGSMTDAQMAQRPSLASRMARLRGYADIG